MQSLTMTKAENVITSETAAGNSSETFLNSQTQDAVFTQALNSCRIYEGKQLMGNREACYERRK